MFRNQIPVVVDRAEGHAKELGIEPLWTFLAIDGWVPGEEFAAFFCGFAERLQALPGSYSLLLLFELPDGRRRTIVQTKRPLGLVFRTSLPPVARHVKDLALTLGIKIGWKLLRFGHSDVGEYNCFKDFWAAFTTAMERVPIEGNA